MASYVGDASQQLHFFSECAEIRGINGSQAGSVSLLVTCWFLLFVVGSLEDH